MKEFKWQILWSTRNSPQEIARLISDIRIKLLLEQRKLPILGYPASDLGSYDDYLLPDLRKPHGRAWNISIEDDRYMVTFGVTDGTACAISFINENVPDKEYSPDNMPENSMTILYCPEEAYIEIIIGNDSVFILRFEPGHKCQCKCASLYKEKNNEMYTIILNSIKIACNNLDY